MTNKKTYAELEKEQGKYYEMVAKVFYILSCVLIVVIICLVYFNSMKVVDCKSQLQECQEDLPVWTLKVNCTEEDWLGADYFNQVMTLRTSNYSDYLDWLEDFENMEYINCEVIE